MKNFLNPKSYKGIIPQGEGQTLTLSRSNIRTPAQGQYDNNGDTVFTLSATEEYTTANATAFGGNYIDMINGAIYAQNAPHGYNGAQGGAAGGLGNYTPISSVGASMSRGTDGSGEDGENGFDEANSGAKGGKGAIGQFVQEFSSNGRYEWSVDIGGSGGGGAAYSPDRIKLNGSDAIDGKAINPQSRYDRSYECSPAGAGAVAYSWGSNFNWGSGGNGGNGGGGAGSRCKGYNGYYRDSTTVRYDQYVYPEPATAGDGSNGQNGADGCIIIYW